MKVRSPQPHFNKEMKYRNGFTSVGLFAYIKLVTGLNRAVNSFKGQRN